MRYPQHLVVDYLKEQTCLPSHYWANIWMKDVTYRTYFKQVQSDKRPLPASPILKSFNWYYIQPTSVRQEETLKTLQMTYTIFKTLASSSSIKTGLRALLINWILNYLKMKLKEETKKRCLDFLILHEQRIFNIIDFLWRNRRISLLVIFLTILIFVSSSHLQILLMSITKELIHTAHIVKKIWSDFMDHHILEMKKMGKPQSSSNLLNETPPQQDPQLIHAVYEEERRINFEYRRRSNSPLGDNNFENLLVTPRDQIEYNPWENKHQDPLNGGPVTPTAFGASGVAANIGKNAIDIKEEIKTHNRSLSELTKSISPKKVLKNNSAASLIGVLSGCVYEYVEEKMKRKGE